MSEQFAINISRPIKSARIVDSAPASIESNYEHKTNPSTSANRSQLPLDISAEHTSMRDIEIQKAELSQTCRALKAVAIKLKQLYDNIFTRHKEEIARLSTEIARRILVQKIEKGDYKIETIVKEAIQNAPTAQNLEVYLNPADLEQCQKALKNEPDCSLTGLELLPDPNIGRAECRVKSPKGIVESFIDVHLERISEALKKAN